jgi:hypothetical protein
MLGCQVGQGFYFSRPLRAEEFDELLTRHFTGTAGPTGPLLISKSANTSSVIAAPARPGAAPLLPPRCLAEDRDKPAGAASTALL